jgi:hypothetical protein
LWELLRSLVRWYWLVQLVVCLASRWVLVRQVLQALLVRRHYLFLGLLLKVQSLALDLDSLGPD